MQPLYNSNLFVSLAATIFFSYAILRLNKENEVAILQEKKFGDTIFNTSLDGVFIVFSESAIIANCNYRALELFEANSLTEVEGMPVSNWFNEDQVKLFSSIEQPAPESAKSWQGELAFNTRKGKKFYGYVSVVPFTYKSVRYTKGQYPGYLRRKNDRVCIDESQAKSGRSLQNKIKVPF